MNDRKNLAALRQGERGVVAALNNTGSIRQRLQDLGLVEGTAVECVGNRPRGGMKAYRIRGAVIALRQTDSRQVLLLTQKEEHHGDGK